MFYVRTVMLVLFMGLPWLAGVVQAQEQEPAIQADQPPADPENLAGTYWKLHIDRYDRETWAGRPMQYALDLVFLPDHEVLLTDATEKAYNDTLLLDWSVGWGGIRLKDDSVADIKFRYANGKTTGKGRKGIFKFKITGFEYQGKVDLLSPRFAPLINHSTCDFVSISLQAAADNFFNMYIPGSLRGATKTDRYSGLVTGSIRGGSSDNWSSVKKEHLRRVADMQGCVVTVNGNRYGLEALVEPEPGKLTDRAGAVYRLKAAPPYLARLRAAVISDWRVSAWTQVFAGRDDGTIHGVEFDLEKAYTWQNISDAPAVAPVVIDAAGAVRVLEEQALAAERAGNLFEAVRLRNEACARHDDVASCHRVARAYYEGEGLGRQPDRGRDELFALCEERNHAESCFFIGNRLAFGNADEKWRIRAADALEKACNLNHAGACNDLGYFLEKEEQIKISGASMGNGSKYELALKMYVRACELGNATGCANAAITYQNGALGVEVDEEQALMFHAEACLLGREESCL